MPEGAFCACPRENLSVIAYAMPLPGLRLPASASLSLASCWPLPQQLLPASATGGGRRRCLSRGGLGIPESLASSPEAPLLGELSAKQTERLYEGKPAGRPKPLPLGEVSPKVTERASPSPESRDTAIGRPFGQSDAIAALALPRQRPCPLSLAFARQGRVAAPSVCFAVACILLAAAPAAPPCFRRWRRSSPLPQRGSHWRAGQAHARRAKFDFIGNSSALLQRFTAA